MGIDYNIYVGSFLKFKNKIIETTKEITICPSHDLEMNTKFCPECGNKGIKKTIMETEELDLEEIIPEEIENYYYPLTSEDTELEDREYIIRLNNDSEYYNIMDFGEIMTRREMPIELTEIDLTREFGIIIDNLKKHRIKYEYHYGIITYYS